MVFCVFTSKQGFTGIGTCSCGQLHMSFVGKSHVAHAFKMPMYKILNRLLSLFLETLEYLNCFLVLQATQYKQECIPV